MTNFEDYTVSYIVGPSAGDGLFPVKNTSMIYFDDPGPGKSNADDEYQTISLGFTFKFENQLYTDIYVSTNGWAVLHSGSFSDSEVLTNSAVFKNADITGSFSKNHLLCAPWFDDLRNVFRSLDSPGAASYITGSSFQGLHLPAGTVELIRNGMSDFPPGVDSTLGGMKYVKLNTSDNGKCIVIRWKSFAYYVPYKNIVNFDLVIYESGIIEFRYSPKIVYGYVSKESATIGFFASGNRYRDLGGFIKRSAQDDSANGGKIYTVGFEDYDTSYIPAMTSSYISSLNTSQDWPGLKSYGAIFRLSPVFPRKKFNKSDVARRQSVSFVNSGYYNDQDTVIFSSGSVHYPVMLPESMKFINKSGNTKAITSLFQTGTISVNSTVQSGLYEQILQDVFSK